MPRPEDLCTGNDGCGFCFVPENDPEPGWSEADIREAEEWFAEEDRRRKLYGSTATLDMHDRFGRL